MATAAGNRGKYAEGKTRDYLKLLETQLAGFTFNRVQDAHSAGGRFTPQAGDFQAFHLQADRSRNFIIEVKEVAHDFRLPHKNYSEDKVARVQKRAMAGTECLVLVCHTTTKLWRAVPFDVFRTRTGGSWDLRTEPVVDYKAALANFFGIK